MKESWRYCVAVARVFLGTLVAVTCVSAESQQTPVSVYLVVTAASTPARLSDGTIPLDVTIINGLDTAIGYLTYSLTPNEWHGETMNVSLVDIYRNGQRRNINRARPGCTPEEGHRSCITAPRLISGPGLHRIPAGKSLVVRIDAAKWLITDGWIPGRYTITARVDNVQIDEKRKLSVLSEPIEVVLE